MHAAEKLRDDVNRLRFKKPVACARHPSPSTFFDAPTRAFVVNFCPLLFLEECARNMTPDKLPARERVPLEAACRRHLAQVIVSLHPEIVIGVGAYAAKQVKQVLAASPSTTAAIRWGMLPHPSPASPAANRGWTEMARTALQKLHVDDVL